VSKARRQTGGPVPISSAPYSTCGDYESTRPGSGPQDRATLPGRSDKCVAATSHLGGPARRGKSGTLERQASMFYAATQRGWHQTCSVKRGAKRVPRTRFVSCTKTQCSVASQATQVVNSARGVRCDRDSTCGPAALLFGALTVALSGCGSHSRGGASQSMLPRQPRAADDRRRHRCPGSALNRPPRRWLPPSRPRPATRRARPEPSASERAVAVSEARLRSPSRSSPSRQRARHLS